MQAPQNPHFVSLHDMNRIYLWYALLSVWSGLASACGVSKVGRTSFLRARPKYERDCKMFGWLRRIGKKKTPPETTERVEEICKIWKEQLDHNERLRRQEQQALLERCHAPEPTQDREERAQWLLDCQVALNWYCRWERTRQELTEQRFEAWKRRQQFLQQQEFARLQYYRELPPTVLIVGIRDPMRSRRLFHTCLHETRESPSAKSTNQAAEP